MIPEAEKLIEKAESALQVAINEPRTSPAEP